MGKLEYLCLKSWIFDLPEVFSYPDLQQPNGCEVPQLDGGIWVRDYKGSIGLTFPLTRLYVVRWMYKQLRAVFFLTFSRLD